MLKKELKTELLKLYTKSLHPPYTKGIIRWVEDNIVLPAGYAIPGKLDLSISPYLHKPLQDIDDPKVEQILMVMATQIGKTMVNEISIPYFIVNKPGPIFRIFQNANISSIFAETRLIPLLKNIECIKPLLSGNRFSTKKSGIILPHMAVTLGGANDGLAHGMSVKYLICDELHDWDIGFFEKFTARTTAFAGKRKIIVSTQPNSGGSELEKIYLTGKVFEWQWLCPECKKRQPYVWSQEKEKGGWGGFNWDTILNADGETTNIEESSKTTWLECLHCDCKIHDTPSERRYLNDTGEYVCIKSDGDPTCHSYTCPNFVNVNLTFAYAAGKYMLAKREIKMGLHENMQIFVNTILGKFYNPQKMYDVSKILTEVYDKEKVDKDWTNILSVDVQRKGNVKYWIVRSWHKNGNESRRLDFGVCRDWEEIEVIRKKYNVPLPMVGIDSGDGERTQEIYQECIKHGQVIKINNTLQYICWTPLKGDQKPNYKHPVDGINRLYSPTSNQESGFPNGHKLKGIPVPLILWSNYGVKSVLANLRDNKIEGVKWVVDRQDEEYDQQMFSESIKEVVDKKSGLTTLRWIQTSSENHFFDCEAMNLLQAIRGNLFSSIKINEEDIQKLINNEEKNKMKRETTTIKV